MIRAMRRPSATSVLRLAGLLMLAALATASSCEEPEPVDPLDPNRFTEEECFPEGETRCAVNTYQVCHEGYWYNETTCINGQYCNVNLVCVDCEPLSGPACDGDQVRACNSDGTFGAVMDVCEPGECEYGNCGDDDCPEGTDLVYVVDSSHRLLSFDPREDAFTFQLLGVLNCPAGQPWPEWFSTVASPFSMSVDRTGTAWVLYTSGQIFWVDTQNPEVCNLSPYVPGSSNFELFGMGFVSDFPGAQQETLYVAGGTAYGMQLHQTGRLGEIDPESVQLTPIGSLTPSELGPELTGTGAAESYAYFPGETQASVARIDKSTGQNEQSWSIPALPGPVTAWAFAHWGDRFFIFVTYLDPWEGEVSQVRRFDRETGEDEIILGDHGYRIVGAGVSTCAPTWMD
jgi:hypothetical protein